MLLLARWERMIRLDLPPVQQIKRWRLHMFPLILLVLQFMPYRPSIEPPGPPMPMLPWPRNETGSTNNYSYCEEN